MQVVCMEAKHGVCERANVNDEPGLQYRRHVSVLLPYLDSSFAGASDVAKLGPSVKSPQGSFLSSTMWNIKPEGNFSANQFL